MKLIDSLAISISDNLWKLISMAEPLYNQKVNKETLEFYLSTTCQTKVRDSLGFVIENLKPE
jgi:hypothetical protein